MRTTLKNLSKSAPREQFEAMVNTVLSYPGVLRQERKGFGAGALTVEGRIFAMLSSKGHFVVKLPRNRVEELAKDGRGKAYDPGHGRVMKEWFESAPSSNDWVELALEAYRFVHGALGGSVRAARGRAHSLPRG